MRASSNKADIDAAIEHLLWCVERQSDGFFPVRVLRTEKDGQHSVEDTRWFDNCDPQFEKGLRAFLKKYCREPVTVLYSPCAFSKRSAKAQYALPNEVAYVDADRGRNQNFRPEPTRIIKSSEGGEHWFWLLDDMLSPSNLQAVNKALTYAIGGDKNGHSPAKLFRLPGFPNCKYDPPFRVALSEDTGEIHDATEFLKMANKSGRPATSNVSDFSDALSISKCLNADSIVEQYKAKLSSNTRARLRQRKICGPMRAVSKDGMVSHYPGDDRSDIYWGIAVDLRKAGATPAEILAVVTNTIFWKARERDGKAEDPERFIERIYEVVVTEEAVPQEDVPQEAESVESFTSVLEAIDPATWEGLPKPVRRWLIKNWIPLLKVTLLYGDGGTGKTLLALMLAVAVALGHDFLGLEVTQGRVYAFLGENDDTDTHIALVDICRHYGIGLGDLKGRVRIASRSGFDNVLMHFEKGTGQHSELFKQLLADVTFFNADLVIMETAADLFGGNENARGEVRQFVANCCELIAKEADAAVVLCAHPSVAGLRSGEGTSGTTAWNNSARSRLYLRRDIDDKGHEADPDYRVLTRMKANFAPSRDAIDLYWRDGVFVPNNLIKDRLAITDKDQKLIDEVARAYDSGTPWSAHHQAGHRYVVSWIGPNLKQTQKASKNMLSRLISEGRIVEVQLDAHTRKTGLCTPEQEQSHLRDKRAK